MRKQQKKKRRQRKKSLALTMAAQLSKTNKLFWEETESWPEQEFFLTRTEVCRRVWGTKTSELPEGSMKFCRLGGRFPYSGAKEWHRTSSHVSKRQMVKSCFFQIWVSYRFCIDLCNIKHTIQHDSKTRRFKQSLFIHQECSEFCYSWAKHLKLLLLWQSRRTFFL